MFMERGFGLDDCGKASEPYFPPPRPVKASSRIFRENGESCTVIVLIRASALNVNRIPLTRVIEEKQIRAGVPERELLLRRIT
jgi:hypothetical protein